MCIVQLGKAFSFSFSKFLNNKVFNLCLKMSMSSSNLISIGMAFQSLLPLYANILFPCFVLAFGVSSIKLLPLLPSTNFRLMLSEHKPLTALYTIRIVLNVIRCSTLSQCNSLIALGAFYMVPGNRDVSGNRDTQWQRKHRRLA